MPNSWQSPVSGEPSLGTPHPHYAIILNVDPSATTLQTLSLSANVPVGTKRVRGVMFLSAATAGRTFIVYDATGTKIYGMARAQVANVAVNSWFDTPVDSNLNIYWKIDNADVSAVRLDMVSYDI